VSAPQAGEPTSTSAPQAGEPTSTSAPQAGEPTSTSAPQAGCAQVSTAVPDAAAAEAVAAALLDGELAACVQVVGPVRSHYRWEGERHADEEWLCLAKTTAALVERVTGAIIEVHPYEEPEVVATPITGGSPGYLAWVAAEVGG
jgi:periplasmic divalent cation tolerance protein